MNAIKYLLCAITCFFVITSCGDKTEKLKPETKNYNSFSFEIRNSDTINRTDGNGNRQGPWIIFKNAIVNYTTYSTYPPDTVTYKTISKETKSFMSEKGVYKDNKKQGIWTSFFPDGKFKKSVTYKNDSLQ